MLPTSIPPRASALALATLLAATVTGCTSEEAGSGGGSGVTVQTAQFSWTAAGLTNSILSEIATDHPDLGVASLATTQLDLALAAPGLTEVQRKRFLARREEIRGYLREQRGSRSGRAQPQG